MRAGNAGREVALSALRSRLSPTAFFEPSAVSSTPEEEDVSLAGGAGLWGCCGLHGGLSLLFLLDYSGSFNSTYMEFIYLEYY